MSKRKGTLIIRRTKSLPFFEFQMCFIKQMGQRFGKLCVGSIGTTVFCNDNHIVALFDIRSGQAKSLPDPTSDTVTHNGFFGYLFADNNTEMVLIVLIVNIIKVEMPVSELLAVFKNPLKCFIAF